MNMIEFVVDMKNCNKQVLAVGKIVKRNGKVIFMSTNYVNNGQKTLNKTEVF